jgi:hypothetical protein
LDADDLLDASKLEAQIDCFQTHPAADIVYGRSKFFEMEFGRELFDNKKKTREPDKDCPSGKGDKMLGTLVHGNFMVVSAPLVRRRVFEKVGGFDLAYKSYEDWQYWVRCALAGMEFVFCESPPVCTYIRFGFESMMSDTKKLLLASVQLRRFLIGKISGKMALYNHYRMRKSQLKLLLRF